jgi:hypothetical protein
LHQTRQHGVSFRGRCRYRSPRDLQVVPLAAVANLAPGVPHGYLRGESRGDVAVTSGAYVVYVD